MYVFTHSLTHSLISLLFSPLSSKQLRSETAQRLLPVIFGLHSSVITEAALETSLFS